MTHGIICLKYSLILSFWNKYLFKLILTKCYVVNNSNWLSEVCVCVCACMWWSVYIHTYIWIFTAVLELKTDVLFTFKTVFFFFETSFKYKSRGVHHQSSCGADSRIFVTSVVMTSFIWIKKQLQKTKKTVTTPDTKILLSALP